MSNARFVFIILSLSTPLASLQSQYTFLHDAILEGYISGDTEIMMDELDKRITELEATDDWGISGFRKEFEVSVLCIWNLSQSSLLS